MRPLAVAFDADAPGVPEMKASTEIPMPAILFGIAASVDAAVR